MAGGRFTIEFALCHPERVRSIALLGGSLPGDHNQKLLVDPLFERARSNSQLVAEMGR